MLSKLAKQTQFWLLMCPGNREMLHLSVQELVSAQTTSKADVEIFCKGVNGC